MGKTGHNQIVNKHKGLKINLSDKKAPQISKINTDII